MAQTVSGSSQCLTMEDYLAYDDGTDTRYELVNGELTVMPPESQVNASIAKFLFFELAKYLLNMQREALQNIGLLIPNRNK